MNLRERRWRRQIAEVLAKLDERIHAAGEGTDDTLALISLRERLAGTVGAEEGWTSTPELRSRARTDYAEALEALGLDAEELPVPAGDPPKDVVQRNFDSYRPSPPKRGDRT